MKKLFTLICTCTLTLPSFAQIEIDSNDFPKKDSIYKLFQTDDFSGVLSAELDWGTGQANEVYDFSALDKYLYDTNEFVLHPTSVFGMSQGHPGAQLGAVLDFEMEDLRPLHFNSMPATFYRLQDLTTW